VNPADPKESLLALPARPPIWPALAGGLAILFGVALGVYVWRMPATTQHVPVPKKGTGPGNGTAPGRKPAPPLSRLRPPPAVKREAPVHDDVTGPD
jgi:hypothetical protein